ncbi:hypothetical protein [Microvirga brassicacearum]|uniref:Uncharacterized protein n=1 Tax=Microvirga brassicacearum TaxID=2580413 RepID=A0A5N3P5X9_9HYPH|nr:hypothetical protein [Microvirga brassicacearum]KAB0265138.1 hypothetical protein FEZ63_20065 [Microvirga brassicacearum]
MRALVLSLALLAFTAASAQPAAPPANWRTMTLEQLNALPKEQATQLPVIEFLERTDPNFGREKMEPIVATLLSRLMYAIDRPLYPFGAFLGMAVREFQDDLGAKADGALKFSEMEVLASRVRALDRTATPIFPPFKTDVHVSPTNDYVAFGGTWVIEGDKHAYPVNFTTYKCFKSEKLCYTADGNLIMSSGSGTMNVDSGFLKIIKWDNSELLMEDDARCRVTTTSVNLKNKEVLQITRNRDEGCDATWLPPLTTPRISRLVDGFKANQELNQKQAEINQKNFSKRFQEIAKKSKN